MYYRIVILVVIVSGISLPGLARSKKSSLADTVIQENITGTTLGKDGDVHFQAKKALFNKSDNTLEMQDEVMIETEDGLKLETDSIKWSQDKDKVFTDEKVRITKDKDVEIQGRGLDAQPSLKTARIGQEVEVTIPQQDQDFIMITCAGPLEIDYQEGLAIFYNDVKVDQKGTQLYSDKAKVYFDLQKQALTEIVAEGNVRIVRGNDTSYSEKARYDPYKKKVILEGRPRLVIFPESGESPFDFGS